MSAFPAEFESSAYTEGPVHTGPLKVGEIAHLSGDTRAWKVIRIRPNLYCDYVIETVTGSPMHMEVAGKWLRRL